MIEFQANRLKVNTKERTMPARIKEMLEYEGIIVLLLGFVYEKDIGAEYVEYKWKKIWGNYTGPQIIVIEKESLSTIWEFVHEKGIMNELYKENDTTFSIEASFKLRYHFNVNTGELVHQEYET